MVYEENQYRNRCDGHFIFSFLGVFLLVKKIVSFFLAFASLFLLATSCFAGNVVDDVVDGASPVGSLYDAFRGDDGMGVGEYFGTLLSGGFRDHGPCHGRTGEEFYENHFFKADSTSGLLANAWNPCCIYCGKSYKQVLAEEDGKSESDISDGVLFKCLESLRLKSLPASSYSSDGSLLWYPTIDDFSGSAVYLLEWRSGYSPCRERVDLPFAGFSASYYSFSSGANGRSIHLRSSKTVTIGYFGVYEMLFIVPCSGSYRRIESCAAAASGLTTDGVKGYFLENYTSSSYSHFDKGGSISSSSVYESLSSPSTLSYVSGEQYLPTFQIIPDDVVEGGSSSDPTSSITQVYSSSTRVGNYVGSYAVYNNDSGYSYVGGTSSVVNESDNRVWNPVTNTTNDYSGWTYDYSTRTYNFYNDDNSSTSTVTYGDENITIADTVIDGNGNTITNNYTVYYYTGNGSDDPGPSPSPSSGPDTPSGCKHNYKTTVTREPTCTMAGSQTLTCSLCGETKTEKLPSTGHTWAVRQTVSTAYDDGGNLVQQGYTIYKCSVCGEEYKDVDGAGPPGSGDDDGGGLLDGLFGAIGSLLGGAFDLLGSLLGGLLDGLVGLLEMLLGKLGTVVEAVLSVFNVLPSLFQGFLDLLSALFPFIPEEAMAVLTFGIIAVVVVAIVRLFF